MIWEGQWGRKKVAVPTPDPVVPLLWQEKQAWQGQNGILSSWKSALRSPKLFTEVDMIPTLDVKTPNFRKLRNCLLSQCKHHCWRAGHRSHCHFKSLWFNARALRRILLVKEDVYINMKCGIYYIKYWYFLVKIFIIGSNFKMYVQFSCRSVVSLCDPMNHSTPGLLVHHQLPEFTQTHVHWVGDIIQPSHPRSSPSPPAPNPPQHQGFFQWVNSSCEEAKVLRFQLQHQSFQWTPRNDFL